MPNLAQLTDAYTPIGDNTGLPVEQIYTPKEQAISIRPLSDVPIVAGRDTRPEPLPEPTASWLDNVGMAGVEDKSGKSEHPLIKQLFGLGGEERYQLWPERMVRSGLSAAGNVISGVTPQWAVDPVTGDVHTSPQMIEAGLDTAALAGTGGLAGTTDATLGSTPFLRPALKYKDKIYKAPEGGQHLDALPAHLADEFNQMAMSGEDISHYKFGFMDEKGRFLDREKALEHGINTGLIDPHAGKYGALTSTLLSDSSKPGVAIESLKKYPLAKPSDRWINTLGQNDNLIQNMTPDEFLNNSRPLKIDTESRENINAIKQHIKEGKPLDPLELHANGKEDGRHRAIAAKELGIKEVPVINYRLKSDNEAGAALMANKPKYKFIQIEGNPFESKEKK